MERQKQIETMLQAAFNPSYLRVVNESHMHSVPANSETHFKLTVASNCFLGQSKVMRHQKIYGILKDLMQDGLHAVALHTYTNEEWQQIQQQTPKSPNCMGGSKGA